MDSFVPICQRIAYYADPFEGGMGIMKFNFFFSVKKIDTLCFIHKLEFSGLSCFDIWNLNSGTTGSWLEPCANSN